MDRWTRVTRVVPGLILLCFSAAEAHKGWFLDTAPYPLRWSLFLQPLPLVITLLAVLTVAALAWVHHQRSGAGFLPGPERFGAAPRRLAGLYALMPLLLGIHVAVPLAINAMQRHLFVPDVPLPLSVLDLFELGIALALFFGILTRYAAVALALLWVFGIFLVGLRPMLENIHFLGYAGFFFFAGRGPISVDRILFPQLEPDALRLRLAIPALRVGIALSIIAVAFTEKLADLPYALAFLQKYPLNFVHQVGIPLPDTLFLVGAGGVELGIGLMLLFNLFTREISVLAWVFFNLTLSVFDVTELINHLPFYAAMFLLILWKPSEHSQELWRAGLQDALLPLEQATVAGVPGRA